MSIADEILNWALTNHTNVPVHTLRRWAAEVERLEAQLSVEHSSWDGCDAERMRLRKAANMALAEVGFWRRRAFHSSETDLYNRLCVVHDHLCAALKTTPPDAPDGDEAGPAVGDVVLGRGRSGWVRRTDGRKIYVEVGSGQWEGWQLDECTIIARRVDSLAEAMRLLRGEARDARVHRDR